MRTPPAGQVWAVVLCGLLCAACHPSADWSPSERRQIDALWLGNLSRLPPDPPALRRFGHQLFFDTRLSSNQKVACATCHQPQQRFADSAPLSRGIGLTQRNSPSLIGVAFSPWLYWDGRKDSLWSQALAPLEHPDEMGHQRVSLALLMYDPAYRPAYEASFGPLPAFTPAAQTWASLNPAQQQVVNQVFSNIGKAIAAYERLLLPGISRFDRYAQALQSSDPADEFISRQEKQGLRLFLGTANCIQCHNGPLFTNNAFHNTGLLSAPGQTPDPGRIRGLRLALADEFNCTGSYSDAGGNCAELLFAQQGPALLGAMRTPSLRNLADTAPYGHAGQFPDLHSVLTHYNEAPLAMIGHNEAKPLNLWPWQIKQLEAFLKMLDAPPQIDPQWLQSPEPR